MLNRRTVIKSLTIGSLACLGSSSAEKVLAMTNQSKPRYSWIFLYWMPYDNDLSRLGDDIMSMLAESIQTDNILIAVQADLAQQQTLSRTILSSESTESYFLESEDSADPENFATFLNWAAHSYQADNWVIAFMGHGGQLMQISPDYDADWPESQRLRWMEISDIRDAILHFNQKTGKLLELFFFQNCNKSTLEACCIMSPVANYILASQNLLGAPNYYYAGVFQFLGNSPNINGKQLAHKIREFETPDMYIGYTVVDCKCLPEVTIAINELIDVMFQQDWESVDLTQLPRIRYAGETYVDIVLLLSAISEQTQTDPVHLNSLIEHLEQVFEYLPNPNPLEFLTFGFLVLTEQDAIDALHDLKLMSGLSVYFPQNLEQLAQYADADVYEGLNFLSLFDRLLSHGKLEGFSTSLLNSLPQYPILL